MNEHKNVAIRLLNNYQNQSRPQGVEAIISALDAAREEGRQEGRIREIVPLGQSESYEKGLWDGRQESRAEIKKLRAALGETDDALQSTDDGWMFESQHQANRALLEAPDG